MFVFLGNFLKVSSPPLSNWTLPVLFETSYLLWLYIRSKSTISHCPKEIVVRDSWRSRRRCWGSIKDLDESLKVQKTPRLFCIRITNSINIFFVVLVKEMTMSNRWLDNTDYLLFFFIPSTNLNKRNFPLRCRTRTEPFGTSLLIRMGVCREPWWQSKLTWCRCWVL